MSKASSQGKILLAGKDFCGTGRSFQAPRHFVATTPTSFIFHKTDGLRNGHGSGVLRSNSIIFYYSYDASPPILFEVGSFSYNYL